MRIYIFGTASAIFQRYLQDHFNIVSSLDDADLAIVFGGDGSVLRASHQLVDKHKDLLIIGINTGTVGFLSNDISVSKLTEVLADIKSITQPRMRLDFQVQGTPIAPILNEVSFHPTVHGSLLRLEVDFRVGTHTEGLFYEGDGLLVSTASGSTAYNLSAGGPILSPSSRAVLVTPLNPFSLTSKPVVIDDELELRIRATTSVHVVADGIAVREFEAGEEIRIRPHQTPLQLLKVDGFICNIQQKLGWNVPIKNWHAQTK